MTLKGSIVRHNRIIPILVTAVAIAAYMVSSQTATVSSNKVYGSASTVIIGGAGGTGGGGGTGGTGGAGGINIGNTGAILGHQYGSGSIHQGGNGGNAYGGAGGSANGGPAFGSGASGVTPFAASSAVATHSPVRSAR
jgi:hypothetical protein